MNIDRRENGAYEISGLKDLMNYADQSHILQTWKPVAFLGAGQFSFVYRVVHRQTGAEAALKYIPNPKEAHRRGRSGSQEDEINRMRFDASRREAEVMSRFRGDRHIVQFLERPEFLQRVFVNQWGEQVWQYAALICMPLYHSSAEWLPMVVGNRQEGLHLGMQMASALVLFEQKGAFHRDIKPGNILMDDDRNFYLCDVGEAKMEYEDASFGFHGTPWYMAPEVERRRTEQTTIRSDHRSDIYSLGMVLYKIFNRNQYPFLTRMTADSNKSVLTEEALKTYQRFERKRIKEGSVSISDRSYDRDRAYMMVYGGEKLPAPCDADEQLARVILKACAYDIEKRYQTAAEFLDALTVCASGKPLVSNARKKGGARLGAKGKMLAAGAVLIIAAVGTKVVIDGGPRPVPTPVPVASLTPSPDPTATPSPAPAATPSPAPTATPSPTPTATPSPAPTADTGASSFETREREDGTLEITRYTGDDAAVSIPPKIRGKGVTRIGDFAFRGCSSLEQITLPEAVTEIGDFAFSGCSSLTQVYLPKALSEMGANPFTSCSNLRTIVIPDELEGYSFREGFLICDHELIAYVGDETSIVVPNEITRIGDSAFRGCSVLKQITLLEAVTEIGEWTFRGCSSLEQITLPEAVMEIGEWAFSGCSALKQITLPGAVKEISEYTFEGCSSLEQITLPEAVKRINMYAFEGCSSLEQITLPEAVKEISMYAFEGCSSLKQITLSESITWIAYSAFENCSESLTLIVPDGSYAERYAKENGIHYETVNVFYTDVSNFETREREDGTLAISGYTGSNTVVSIPAKIAGRAVTEIEEDAFKGCIALEKVTLPDSVTKIGANAFYGCSALKEIALPDGISKIGASTFNGCSALEKVTIPEGITEINNRVFWNCSALEAIMLPGTIEKIGEGAFGNCSALKKIMLPEGVTKIGNRAFSGCHALEEITLPDTVTGIGNLVFWECSSLKEITLPDSVTEIGLKPFFDCSALKKITLPKTMKAISKQLFYGCSGLEQITLQDGITEIGTEAFYGCSALRNIVIPDTVTKIGEGAFGECSALEKITLPDSLKEISFQMFWNCKALKNITIPNGVTEIAPYAFNTYGAKKITLPVSVEEIGYCAFSPDVTLVVPAGSYAETYAKKNGIKYETKASDYDEASSFETSELGDGTLAITGYKGGATVIKLPAEIDGKKVTAIGSNAFEDCTSITQITIPDSVMIIGNMAFSGCWSLAQIAIPDSVTSIGTGLFDGCTSLTDVRLPRAYLDDSNNLFAGCPNLKTIILPEEAQAYSFENGFFIRDDTLIAYLGNEETVRVPDAVKKIGVGAFDRCVSLKQVSLPESVTEIGRNAFRDCSRMAWISMSDAVTRIGDWAFSGCASLTEIQLPKALTALEANPFVGCTSLETLHIPEEASRYSFENGFLMKEDNLVAYLGSKATVTVPESVKSINDSAFENCTFLKRVVLPDSVTYIGAYAFFCCDSLEQIVLPESVSGINVAAFSCCSSLEQVTLPNAVTRIETAVFESCETFKQFTIPDSVTSIGLNAFWNCTSLERVEIPNSVTSIDSSAFEDCPKSLTIVAPAGSYAETYAKENGIAYETR